MRRICLAFVMAVLLLLTMEGMKNAGLLAQNGRSISIRYQEPLPQETVQTAKEKIPGLTFWTEEEGTVSSGLRTAESRLLWYWGESALVLGDTCISGQTPAALDTNGCAVSTALAWELFGSQDVVGLTLSPEKGREYTVRGVFESRDCLALIPRKDSSFKAVELEATEETREDPETWAASLLQESGLPEPQWTLDTFAVSELGKFLAWLPLLFGGAAAGVALIKGAVRWNYPVRDIAFFALFLGVGLALTVFLEKWPSWLTPSRWSDFSWWGVTAGKIREEMEAFLVAPGMGRDLAVKTGILKQAGIGLAQGILCEVLRCGFRPKTPEVQKGSELTVMEKMN